MDWESQLREKDSSLSTAKSWTVLKCEGRTKTKMRIGVTKNGIIDRKTKKVIIAMDDLEAAYLGEDARADPNPIKMGDFVHREFGMESKYLLVAQPSTMFHEFKCRNPMEREQVFKKLQYFINAKHRKSVSMQNTVQTNRLSPDQLQQQRQSGVKLAESLDKAHDEVETLNTKLKSAESLIAELEATKMSDIELQGLVEMELRTSMKNSLENTLGRVSDTKLQSKLQDASETIQVLRTQSKEKDAMIFKLNQMMSTSRKQLRASQMELRQDCPKCSTLQIRLESSEGANLELRGYLKDKDDQIQEMKIKMLALHKQIEQCGNEKEQIKNDLRNCTKAVKAKAINKLRRSSMEVKKLKTEALETDKIIKELNAQNKHSQDKMDKMRETLKERDVVIEDLRHVLYVEKMMKSQRANDDEKMDGGVGHQEEKIYDEHSEHGKQAPRKIVKHSNKGHSKRENMKSSGSGYADYDEKKASSKKVMKQVLDQQNQHNISTEKPMLSETEGKRRKVRTSTSSKSSENYDEFGFIGDQQILQKIAIAQELTKRMSSKVDREETSALSFESRDDIKNKQHTLETEQGIEYLREKVDRRDSEIEILTERMHSLLREVELEKHNQKLQMLAATSIAVEEYKERDPEDIIPFEPADTIESTDTQMTEGNSFDWQNFDMVVLKEYITSCITSWIEYPMESLSFVAELAMFLAFLAVVDYMIRGWDEPVVVKEPPASTFQDLDLPAFRELILSLYMYFKAIPFQDWSHWAIPFTWDDLPLDWILPLSWGDLRVDEMDIASIGNNITPYWANVMSNVFLGVASASTARLLARFL